MTKGPETMCPNCGVQHNDTDCPRCSGRALNDAYDKLNEMAEELALLRGRVAKERRINTDLREELNEAQEHIAFLEDTINKGG